jgi:MSHA pilin protein MshC
MDQRRPPRSHGFTLGELVLTIVLMGILAAIAAPRIMSSKGFASRGFYDDAQAVVRFAQKTAIAWRRTIVVCVAADKISAIKNNDCNAPDPVMDPVHVTTPLQTSTAPDGVTLSSVPPGLSFNGMGQPSAATIITFTSPNADDPVREIRVAAETGYVYRYP